jgi:hypothetical protein
VGGSNALGEGGAGGEDEIIYETAGVPNQGPPGACDPEMMLGGDEAQSVGAAGTKLLSMTPDELSLVFVTADKLYVADRSALNQAFSELEVTLPDGYDAASGAALSADGKTLTLVATSHAGFADVTRAARGDAFGAEADETRFTTINDLKMTTGQSVGWPVISSDGKTLYYLSYLSYAVVVQSSLSGNAFAYGTEIDEFTLGGIEGEYKLLSGLSVDQRAIFFFDEATGHAMALFRARDNSPFYDPLDLGERDGVVPNQACDRVYSSVASGVVAQDAQ